MQAGVRHREIAALAFAGAILASCGSSGVVPPGGRDAEAGERAVSAEARLFSVRVTEQRWSAPPQRVLLHHTPLWVWIQSTADQVVRLAPEDWVLIDEDGAATPAMDPERLVATASGSLAETRLIRGQGLRAGSLAPGEEARGFLFFRRRFARSEQGERVTLRITLRAPSGEQPLDSIELPLRVGH